MKAAIHQEVRRIEALGWKGYLGPSKLSIRSLKMILQLSLLIKN